jgi:parallel beta-helix repeat protein
LKLKKKILLAFVLVLLSTAVVVGFIRPAVAEESIYIRADGSIEGTTDISTVDNVTYTFTDNIFNQSIVVERDNIVIDGAGYALQGTGADYSKGIDLTGRSNVTIKNMNIRAFYFGIYLSGSSGNNVSGSNMTNNSYGIALSDFSSSNNSITRNNLGNNGKVGIYIFGSFNTLSGNNITNSSCGIEFSYSSNNMVYGNIITASHYWGVWLSDSLNNSISGNSIANSQYGIYLSYSSNNSVYHNNFIGNTYQVGGTIETSSSNVWDDGAGKGNYWSDYEERYPDAEEIDGSGIWDTPYVVDENNQDNYPLVNVIPEFPTWTSMLLLLTVLTVAAIIYKRRLLKTPIQ